MPRDQLRELNLKHDDVIVVVFRHVRLFPKGEFYETDVEDGSATPPRKVVPVVAETPTHPDHYPI